MTFTLLSSIDSFGIQVCQVNFSGKEYERMKWYISKSYHHNWLLDHLPSASIISWPIQYENFANGFPIGYILAGNSSESSYIYYIFNHFNLVIDYEQEDTGDNRPGYRITEFAVQPLSINHKFEGNYSWDGTSAEGSNKRLLTCPYRTHLSLDNVVGQQELVANKPILFTYDVVWRNRGKPWGQRWEIYLTNDNWVPAKLHWTSVSNSLVVAVLLSSMLVAIWIRSNKRPSETQAQTISTAFRSLWASRRRYTSLNTEEIESTTVSPSAQDIALQEREIQEERNWRCLHADVFRPPATMPGLYCAFVGTGIQLIVTTLAVVVMASLGCVSQAVAGSVPNAFLVTFNLSGCVSGYVSYRLYSSFGADSGQLKRCVGMVALMIPGGFFLSFCFLNICLFFRQSTASLPILDVLIVLSGWLFGLIPLIFLGAYIASLQDVMEFPTHTNPVPREIPVQSSVWKRPFVALVIAGILPFGAIYVELFFSMTSLWLRQYYYVFGVALVVYLLALWIAAATSVLLVCIQLRLENHRWWWLSLLSGGSVAAYFAIYALFVFEVSLDKSIITYMIYCLYTLWISVGIFLVFGSIGCLAGLFFLIKLYGNIETETIDTTEAERDENSGYIMLESMEASSTAVESSQQEQMSDGETSNGQTVEGQQDADATQTLIP